MFRRLSLAALVLVTACAHAPAAGTEDQLTSMVEAERAFAASAGPLGVRDAFLRSIADDGVLFRPGPVNGRQALESGPSPPIALSWYPVYARISASGDLGFTTGPYQVRPNPSAAPTGQGHFVTVWRRGPEGWRFVSDLGTPHPAPGAQLPPWERPADVHLPRPAPAADEEEARESLLAADRAFAGVARERGLAAAILEHGDDQVRLHRPGAFPAIGREAAPALAALDARRYSAVPGQAHVSRAGDFGYVIGEYRLADASGNGRAESGWYERIWVRRAGAPWRLALDIVSPRPPEREE